MKQKIRAGKKCTFNLLCFICSRFRITCGQEMQLAVPWWHPACCRVTRPLVWPLIPIHLGQILATLAFQTTRANSAMCLSIIFSPTLCFLEQPTDMHLKPSQNLNEDHPVLQFYEWKPKNILPTSPGPCNVTECLPFFKCQALPPILFPIFKGHNNTLLYEEL